MKSLLLSAGLMAAALAPADAATIVNGGFVGSFVNGYVGQGSGSTAITGWTVGGNSVDWIGKYWQSADGDGYSVDLSGGNAGSVFQTVTGLVVGAAYGVSFWLSGNPDGPPVTKTVAVDAGAWSTTYTYTVSGSKPAMNWAQYFYTFTATSTAQTLTFSGQTFTAYGAALDAVSISEVPVPAGGLLLLSGLGGIVALRRKR